ncbi:MAG: hypothetical protein HYZ15_06760 [Sphingobacteriales bacterium]|nr:hypothetical protein [Sphingobacteriales bacterium]
MKKIIYYFIIFSTLTILPSFNNQNQYVCNVSCSFKPELSSLTAVSLFDCCDEDNALNVQSVLQPGGGYQSNIDHTGGDVEIYAYVGNNHPSGTLYLYRSGTLVSQQSVSTNTAGSISGLFSNVSCNENFQVDWR